MPNGPFKPLKRVGPMCDLEPRDGNADVFELAVGFEIGFDEVSTGG